MSCDIDGYNEFDHAERRRARKQHECCACELPIRVGDVYERWTVKWDGEVSSHKRCLRCCAIADAIHKKHREEDSDQAVAYALDCGHDWGEFFEGEPPEEVARLAFMLPDEIQREFVPCK